MQIEMLWKRPRARHRTFFFFPLISSILLHLGALTRNRVPGLILSSSSLTLQPHIAKFMSSCPSSHLSLKKKTPRLLFYEII